MLFLTVMADFLHFSWMRVKSIMEVVACIDRPLVFIYTVYSGLKRYKIATILTGLPRNARIVFSPRRLAKAQSG